VQRNSAESKKEYPDIKMLIVGSNPDRKIKSLADDNVVVTGFVEDIRPLLNRAKLFVAPLRSGSGIQNKILEAFACGLPVVTTSYGNAGIKAADEKQVIVRDNPDEFAQIIISLLGDNSKRNELGKSARELVEKEFSWENRAIRLEEIYQSLN
jgi:Glycosyltransferase